MNSSRHIPSRVLTKRASFQDTFTFLLLGILIISMCAIFSAQADISERIVLIRYWHFITVGIFAFILPHLLYPLPRIQWLQQLNPSPKILRNLHLRSLSPLIVLFALSYATLIFFDTQHASADFTAKVSLFAESLLFLISIAVYSLFRYSIIGSNSQEWSEGTKGKGFLSSMQMVGQSSATPAGMYPTFGATIAIAGGGMMLVVIHAYFSAQFSALAASTIYGALLLFSLKRFSGISSAFDRFLYHTSAFYDELFRNPSGYKQGDREPIKVESIYWSPKSFRPSVWSIITQLDRRLPFGRIMILLILFVWILLYSGYSGSILNAVLILVIFIKNATIFISITERIAPLPFNLTMQGVSSWIATRFFVNVRWLAPFYLGLMTAALFSSQISYQDVHFWALIDIATAMGAAIITTLLHEGNYKKKYA